MTGIIVSNPPTVELPPGSTTGGSAVLPGVTYTYALLGLPQTWTAKQTFPLSNISVQAGDVTGLAASGTTDTTNAANISSGTLPAGRMPALTGDVTMSAGTTATTLAAGNAGNLNSGTLLAARMPALTGDITTSAGAVATTLATVNSNVGSFGSATASGTFTVDGKGRLTAAGSTTITPAIGSVTGLATGVATFLGTPSSANLASALTDKTGTGVNVFATSPALVTPSLGAATATTINGAAIDNLAWSTYTPTVTATAGTFTTVSATGRYKQIGKTVFLQADVTMTAIGTAVTNLIISLPFTAASNVYMGIAREHQNTGKSGACVILSGGSTAIAIDASGASFIANGNLVAYGITYEIP